MHLITQFLSKLFKHVSWCHLFPDTHKGLSSHNIFIKLDFILKNSNTRIDCIFRSQSMFIEINNILVSRLRKQWLNLLNDLPLKMVTSLSIIVAMWPLPCRSMQAFRSAWQLCTWLYCVLLPRVHYQRVTNNAILQLPHSLF